jgi:hypothetical protein
MLAQDRSGYFWLGLFISAYVRIILVMSGYFSLGKVISVQVMLCDVMSGKLM